MIFKFLNIQQNLAFNCFQCVVNSVKWLLSNVDLDFGLNHCHYMYICASNIWLNTEYKERRIISKLLHLAWLFPDHWSLFIWLLWHFILIKSVRLGLFVYFVKNLLVIRFRIHLTVTTIVVVFLKLLLSNKLIQINGI